MYQLDGKVLNYEECMEKILDTIASQNPVYYAFHMGVDIYWIDDPYPSWSSEIFLTKDGLTNEYGKLIEPLEEKVEVWNPLEGHDMWTLLEDGVGMIWTPQ